jgi:hypothetical protein
VDQARIDLQMACRGAEKKPDASGSHETSGKYSNQEIKTPEAACRGAGPCPSPEKSMQVPSQPDRGGAPAPLGMVIGAGTVHAYQG